MFEFIGANQIFDGYKFLEKETVLVFNDKKVLVDISNTQQITPDKIKYFDGLLLPGLINCHCHIELSHLKSKINTGSGLVQFISKVLSERNAKEEFIVEESIKAINEMKKNGIVAVGDICNTKWSILAKQQFTDVYFHNFIEVSGFDDEKAQQRFNEIKSVYDIFTKHFPRNQISIVPHAPYSVSDKLFKLINDFSSKILTIHNQETNAENTLIKQKTGAFLEFFDSLNINHSWFKPQNISSFNYWQKHLLNFEKIISVHNTFIAAKDLENKVDNIFFCLCPKANLYIENKLPDVSMLIEKGVTLVLGTDSLASNNELNLKSEIEVLNKNFKNIPIEVWLKAATINGAKALGIDDKFGSFEIGKTAGYTIMQ